MRYFLLGMLLLIILCIALYFILSRVYDYFAYRAEAGDIRRRYVRQHYDDQLEKERLVQKKKQLEHAIEIRSQHFQQLSEIKPLEKELEEINELIHTLETEETR
ncbi:hypothetical protein ERX35_003380 [Macrococcus equipercicus]|uniref:Uncharacterized protein n=1 Tax=Macrococcus equipercicus TaxID=69967 RepID=A0ABQ6R9R3_9STAP|nr:hypothetical protein [Macrococcus equipercicus]KAA1040042.1 hypothetical protein ERX35_003380 [Macrococcus equipercicus]